MRRWQVRLKDYLYPIAMLLVLLIVILAAMTNGFAGLRQQLMQLRRGATKIQREVQRDFRDLRADMLGQVWCITSFSNGEERYGYGHYPGMTTEEVMAFHNGPIWMLRSESWQQETTCFHSWREAAEAEQLPLDLAENTSEEAYQNAVLSFYLDKPDPTPVVAGASEPATSTVTTGTLAAGEEQTDSDAVWCFSEIKTVQNLVVTVPHPPGGRTAIEGVLDMLSDRSAFEEYTIRTSVCFTTWPAAADYITGGEVWLPDDVTEQQYHAAIKKWQDAKR